MEHFRKLGFQVEPFLEILAEIRIDETGGTRANEVFSWSNIYRTQLEELRRRDIVEAGGYSVLSGMMFLSAIPLLAVPPLALAPVGVGLGLGALAKRKATPGVCGLYAFVAAVLQQRVALSLHNVTIEAYYPEILQAADSSSSLSNLTVD